MSVDKNIIKKAVTGIEFTEESKQRIFEGFERKKTLKKIFYMKRITVGVIVTAMLFLCVFMNIMLKNKMTITVYAMTQDGNVKSSVLIPVGNGYIFQIDIPENYMYDCKSLGKESNIFTIYQNEKNIYWIPEKNMLGQIYSNENEKLANNTPDYVDECEFEIVVYDESKEISYSEIIKFELINEECIVMLKK